MERALGAACAAAERGEVPVGCVIVSPDGVVLAETGNRCEADRDPTAHAELLAIRAAAQTLGSPRLAGCDLYVTLEPCAMCAGSVYWAGVGRVVHGLSERDLKEMIGPHPENLTLDLPCRTIFEAGQRPVEVIGPLLSEESAVVHKGFW